jgi:hypothetical protein
VASKPSTVSLAALPESCGRAGTCSPVSGVIGCGIVVSLLSRPINPIIFRSANLGTYVTSVPNQHAMPGTYQRLT